MFPAAPPCDTTRRICRFYSILFDSQNQDLLYGFVEDAENGVVPGTPGTTASPPLAPISEPRMYKNHERVVLAMLDEGMNHTELNTIPPGVALPILEAINLTRQSPPPDWPSLAYQLIWREDLAKMQDIKNGMISRP